MHSLMAFVSLAMVAGVSDANIEHFSRPDALTFIFPNATSHVAEMVVEDPTKNGAVRTVVYRSGQRQREETTYKMGPAQSAYGDIAAGSSWRIGHPQDGAERTLYFSIGTGRSDFSLARTAETDHLLGETCTVWNLIHQDKAAYSRWRETDCVTSDGIVLWQKVFYGDGQVMRSAHAVSVKRRPVTKAEVSVPASALALTAYGDWTPGPITGPNDETWLESGDNSLLSRRLGRLSVTEERGFKWIYRTYSNGTYRVNVRFGASGRLETLDVVQVTESAMPKVPFQPARFQTVLGETCELFNMQPGVADGGLIDCLTEDGLLLSRLKKEFGGGSSFETTALSRGKLTLADVLPPTGMLTGSQRTWSPLQPVTPLPPRQVSADWIVLPPRDAMLAAYPERARSDEVEATVTLTCRLAGNGQVTGCDVVSESPKTYGFGQAAAALYVKYARVRPGNYKAGDFTRTTFKWVLP